MCRPKARDLIFVYDNNKEPPPLPSSQLQANILANFRSTVLAAQSQIVYGFSPARFVCCCSNNTQWMPIIHWYLILFQKSQKHASFFEAGNRQTLALFCHRVCKQLSQTYTAKGHILVLPNFRCIKLKINGSFLETRTRQTLDLICPQICMQFAQKLRGERPYSSAAIFEPHNGFVWLCFVVLQYFHGLSLA